MWTEADRQRHRWRGGRYLSDAEWALLEPLIPPARKGGRPRTTDMREVVNALLYLLRTGAALGDGQADRAGQKAGTGQKWPWRS